MTAPALARDSSERELRLEMQRLRPAAFIECPACPYAPPSGCGLCLATGAVTQIKAHRWKNGDELGGIPSAIAEIQAAIARQFGFALRLLTDYDRRSGIAHPRQLAMYLSRELTDESLPTIARAFGRRHHKAVLHAHRKIAREVAAGGETAATVAELRATLTMNGSRR